MKVPFIIYADLESLPEKISTHHNNPKISTAKINRHITSGYSLFTYCSFDTAKISLITIEAKIVRKSFAWILKKMQQNNQLWKKEMIPLTKEEEKIHCKQKKVIYSKKDLVLIMMKLEKYFKVKDHCHFAGKYRGASHNICNLRYKIPKEIPVVFHNGSTYNYHFTIRELAEEFKGQSECLGENTEKCITFSVPIKKNLITVNQ